MQDEAFNLMDKSDTKSLRKDRWLMGSYLNILADKDINKANEIFRDLEVQEVPRPADLFSIKGVEDEGLTEEDCLQRLIEQAMPEKKKENKT